MIFGGDMQSVFKLYKASKVNKRKQKGVKKKTKGCKKQNLNA